MDLNRLTRKSTTEWWIPATGKMRVPGVIFATEKLVREMDDKVFEQVANVATLPGIVKAENISCLLHGRFDYLLFWRAEIHKAVDAVTCLILGSLRFFRLCAQGLGGRANCSHGLTQFGAFHGLVTNNVGQGNNADYFKVPIDYRQPAHFAPRHAGQHLLGPVGGFANG
jgi:hypothetical protein